MLFLICAVSLWACKGAYADSDAFAHYVQTRDGYIAQARDLAQPRKRTPAASYGADSSTLARTRLPHTSTSRPVSDGSICAGR